MNSKPVLAIISILLLFFSFQVQGEVTGGIQTFEPHQDYSFNAQATGDTVWPESTIQTLTINITVTETPNNISRVYIDVVSFAIVGQVNGIDTPLAGNSNVAEAVLTITNNSIILNSSLKAPNQVDRFYVQIGIFVRTDGNTTLDEYKMRFPDSTTILVERDNFVPLIDLYGFPPDAFFKRFLPLYLMIFGTMAFPGATFLVIRLSQKLKNPQMEVLE